MELIAVGASANAERRVGGEKRNETDSCSTRRDHGSSFRYLRCPTAEGPGGELILIRPGSVLDNEQTRKHDARQAAGAADQYLHAVATALRDEGVTVRVLESQDILPDDIDSTMSEWGVDMIACATRESALGPKLAWRSPLHQALAHSPVPILLSRADGNRVVSETSRPRLLVPLDGSEFAETALPLAEDLAKEWDASLWLTQVVPVQAQSVAEEVAKSLEYLHDMADRLDCDVRIKTVTGHSTATMLIRTVKDWSVTDVVMASHGRTANPRFIMGSVAEALIQHLQCRIVVVPLPVAVSMTEAMR